MQQLDVAFNSSTGCPNAGNTGRTVDSLTSNPDGSCTPPTALVSSRGPENWDHDVAFSLYPVGSSSGITTLDRFGTADFCGGTTGQPYGSPACAYIPFEFARSSRARGGSDSSHLRFVAYAKDAIPWVNWRTGSSAELAGPAAGVSNLTTQNVKDIFTNCTVTKWSQVGATNTGLANTPADNIIIWADQSGSGTRKTFDGFLGTGSNSTNCIPAANKLTPGTPGSRVIFENDASPIVGCTTGTTPPSCDATDGTNTYLSSIYYFSTGPYAQSPVDPSTIHPGHGNGADLGNIDSIAPTSNNIETGTYTFNRQLYNVYRNDYPDPGSNNIPVAALDYIGETGWICKGSNGTVSPGLNDNVVISNGDTDSRGGHIIDPLTGRNYSLEITGDTQHTTPDTFDGLIKTQGFVPLSFGAIGGGVAGNSHCRVS